MQPTFRRLKEHNRDDGGFTLIELLVVIVIIGILAGVVVFAVNGIRDRGEESACTGTAKTIEVASEAYNAQNGDYAATIEAMSPDFLRLENLGGTIAGGTVVTMDNGGTITYDPGDGSVSGNCG